jgi:hypothetical protein
VRSLWEPPDSWQPRVGAGLRFDVEIRRGMAAMDEALEVFEATGVFDRYVCPFCSQTMIGREQTLGHLTDKHTEQIVAQMGVFKAALER